MGMLARNARGRAASTTGTIVLLITCFMLSMVSGGAIAQSNPSADTNPRADTTFDMISLFPRQVVSPSPTGPASTNMRVDVRNVGDHSDWVSLSASSESTGFTASVFPRNVKPTGENAEKSALVTVHCLAGTPEGSEGYVKVTGKRGDEEHQIYLKVTALSSKPLLERSTGALMVGQGFKDPTLQAYTGADDPPVWNLSATNHGAGDDTYALGYRSDFEFAVEFLGPGGGQINDVPVKGLTRNMIYPTAENFTAKVTPLVPLPEGEPQDVTFLLGPGENMTETSEVTVQVVNPGMLFCMNDKEGLRPHPHQVMAGETTSYVLHVTNLEDAPADISLEHSASPGEWQITLDPPVIADLAPGETSQAVLTVVAPAAATVGQYLVIRVTGSSSLGAVDEVDVGAEVTDVPNVYYWSVDGMDPEYLNMNREGTGPGTPGDWLMPNFHAFLGEGVNYSNARDYLPSGTDPNHTNALAGSYTGTSGIYTIGGTTAGFTEHGEVINAPNTVKLMRYGPEGKPLERVFEVAKEETEGKALCGFWSNKKWLTDLEVGKNVDITGHGESYPFFFREPNKYVSGDPESDGNPRDPNSGPFSSGLYSDSWEEIILPTLLGQLNPLIGFGIYVMPINIFFGWSPGSHCEDRYISDSFLQSIREEDPDVSYINLADLDNLGHFVGSSWDPSEWSGETNIYSKWMRRDESLDIMREVDLLFKDFVDLLKQRGVYDNSIVALMSDHGMETLKDPGSGYQIVDLRDVLREKGFIFNEDYQESGSTGNYIWSFDSTQTAQMESALENYMVHDPILGDVRPLQVVNRQEMVSGVDFGEFGRILPMELYSEFWVNNPQGKSAQSNPGDGQVWPDMFVFPLYNYNICIHGQFLATVFNPMGVALGNVPDTLQIGFPATHGGLTTADITLVFKAPALSPGYAPGGECAQEVRIGDITPTIYKILGWPEPECVDGTPLPEVR